MGSWTSPLIAAGYQGIAADLHSSEEENALTLSMYTLGCVGDVTFSTFLLQLTL